MKLIDTHAHLYAKAFNNDRAEMIRRAVERGVTQFYLPNIDSSSIEAMLALEAEYPDRCYPMMGLHPCSVQADTWEAELATVRAWLEKRHFCAVGEIGIDLYWDKSTLPIQEEAFRTQIAWALEYDLPIVIHSRESTEEILAILADIGNDRLRGIFHCFTGDVEQARRAVDLGFYLGIGGVLTFKNSGLDQTIAQIDLEQLVLETDAPYLAPAPYRGKRNESAYVYQVAEKLAEVKGTSLDEIARVTTANAEKIFVHKPQRQFSRS